MRAILIDPFTRSISEVDTAASLDDIYSLLDIDTLTVVKYDPNNALFLDDEGLLKDKASQEYFWLNGCVQPFAGRGLLIGDSYGDNRATSLDVAEVRENVRFLDKEEIDPEEYVGFSIVTW
jgi:hypothetical protein